MGEVQVEKITGKELTHISQQMLLNTATNLFLCQAASPHTWNQNPDKLRSTTNATTMNKTSRHIFKLVFNKLL